LVRAGTLKYFLWRQNFFRRRWKIVEVTELPGPRTCPKPIPLVVIVSESANSHGLKSSVSDLTDIIDVGDDDDVSPIVEKRKPASEGDKPAENTTGPTEQAPPSTDASQEQKQSPQPSAGVKSSGSESDDDDEFSKVLDAGVSVVQTGAQSLYGFFARGVESVQQTGVTNLAMQGLEKSKQVLADGVKAGQDVADKSLEALEKVGEKAMEVFTTVDARAAAEATTPASRSGVSPSASASSAPRPAGAPKRPSVGVVTGDTPRKKAKELTYENSFEEKLGAAAIQSLENLSIECAYFISLDRLQSYFLIFYFS
jgi:hypothetical protein